MVAGGSGGGKGLRRLVDLAGIVRDLWDLVLLEIGVVWLLVLIRLDVVDYLTIALYRLRFRKMLFLCRLSICLVLTLRPLSCLLYLISITIIWLYDHAFPEILLYDRLSWLLALPLFFGLILSMPRLFKNAASFALLLLAADLADDFVD